MSRLLKILAPLALVVFIIAPGVTGFLVKSSIDKAETGYGQAIEKGPFKLVENNFERGWFSSDQTLELDVTDSEFASILHVIGGYTDATDMPSLVIETTATHGVIPLASPSQGGLRPAIAQTESTITLKYDDGELVPLPVKVYSSLGTGQWARLVAEPLNRLSPDGTSTVNWEGADVSASFGKTTRYDGRIGAFDLDSPEARLQSSPINIDGSFTKTKFAFDESQSSMSMEKLTVTPAAATGQMPIVLNDFKANGNLEVDGARAVVTSNINIGAVENSNLNILGIEIASNFDVDAEALSAVTVETRKNQTNQELSAQDAEALFAALSALLTKGGHMKFDKFDIAVEGGTLSMDLDVDLPPGSMTPMEAMSQGKASGNVVIPESVVEALSAVSPDITNSLNMAAMMGFVQQKDNAYRAEVSYANGVLMLNDLPVPVPF
ncbi:MAG: DUF945 family protein [Gammaproteobacteria bacterium]